MAHQLSY